MKIFLASDLHIEFRQPIQYPDADVDLVVLAGDIHKSTQAIRVAEAFRDKLEVPIIQVAGNHEYYGSEYNGVLSDLRTDAAACRDIHFLENDSVTLNGVRFLGCTLWSNFSLYPDITGLSKSEARQYIRDFQLIRYEEYSISPDDMVALYNESYDWLKRELENEVAEKTVVVTHFAPHPAAIHPMFKEMGEDPLTPYFTLDCSSLMRDYNIDVWMYGHTHNSVDTVVEGRTRLVSNQQGYPGENASYVQYQRSKIIEI